MRASRVGSRSPATLSDRPVPRRSNSSSRPRSASARNTAARGGHSQAISMFDTKAGTANTMSTGPSPTTWYATATWSAVRA